MIGGWQFNGIFNARTGLPVNVIRNTSQGISARPDLVGDPYLEDPTVDAWFNTAAFSVAGLGTTSDPVPGSAGRNILRGPGYKSLDASLFKSFSLNSIREGMRFQIRIEAFNITNTTNFANPNAMYGSTNFGKITSTKGNARIIQFAGKFNF